MKKHKPWGRVANQHCRSGQAKIRYDRPRKFTTKARRHEDWLNPLITDGQDGGFSTKSSSLRAFVVRFRGVSTHQAFPVGARPPIHPIASNGEVLLQARLGDAWENVYRFSEQPTWPIDHEVGNWFTCSRPGGLFTENVIAARPQAMCRKTFFNGEVTVRYPDNKMERWTAHDQVVLGDTLHDDFGIVLPDRDLATIFSAMRRFADRTGPGFRLD